MKGKNVLIIKKDAPQFLYQGPRFKRLGLNSGEEFRDVILIPWLQKLDDDASGVVDFDGTLMFSPSFLEETFGGAIRCGLKDKVVKLQFKNMDSFFLDKTKEYIENASKVFSGK